MNELNALLQTPLGVVCYALFLLFVVIPVGLGINWLIWGRNR